MQIEVGSYEAKTKLPELLRGIMAGNRYTITLRGEPVAELVPVEHEKTVDARAAVSQMHAFMSGAAPLETLDLKSLIDAGRR